MMYSVAHDSLHQYSSAVHDIYHRKKNESWWNINVRSSDYETFSVLSRVSVCGRKEGV